MKEMRRLLNGDRAACGPYAVALAEMHKALERYTFIEVAEDIAKKVVEATKEAVEEWTPWSPATRWST
jgi:hypothetical protein